MLSLLTALLPACSIRADRVRANMDAACVTITELADSLVRDEGLTFRQAHEVAAKTARAVIANGAPLGGGFDAFAKAFDAEVARAPALDATAFADAVAPETFVARRTRPGGPAPAALGAALDQYGETLDACRQRTSGRIDRFTAADTACDRAFQTLLKD